MDTDAALILSMKADIRYHEDERYKYQWQLINAQRKKQGQDYKRKSSELYRYLIEYYGATTGKQKWAAHIRRLNAELVRLRRLREEHKQEAARLRGALALYQKGK